MVLPVQKTIETPQLPLVFRWSMSLLCLSCRFFCRQAQMIGIMAGMAPKDRCAATQLCLAGFAGDDAARAVFLVKGLDVPVVCNVRCWPCLCSTVEVHSCSSSASWSDVYGGFWKNLLFFFVNVYFDPEVDSRRGILDIISTSSIWQLRQIQRLLEDFLVFLTRFLRSILGLSRCGLHKEIWTFSL